jgi:outer membrane protein OmpA-like peptidoglycan-associated protein
MRPVGSGRHCEKCDKTIVDLSRIRPRDASLLVALSPGLCARLAASALIAGCSGPATQPVKQPVVDEVRVAEVPADPDPDRDGIPSIDDVCPKDAEDKDSFDDEDGCPDPDNDGDKITDAFDQCPNEPESYNGSSDDDGCPDRLGIVVADAIDVPDRVIFPNGSATIPPTELINAIAALMNTTALAQLRIRGHATPREKFRAALARQRAVAVRDALIAAGVHASRLVIDIVPPQKTDQPEVDFHVDP